MELTPREQLARGIMRVMRESPFFTTIILKHDIVENEHLPAAMGTDGRTLLYNPHIIAELGPDDLREILKHEAMHVANRHHIRMAECEKVYKKRCKDEHIDFRKAFNIAGDLAINSILIENEEKVWTDSKFLQGTCIPGQGHFAAMPPMMTAEWYLKELIRQIEQMPEDLKKQLQEAAEGSGEGEGEAVTGIEPGTGIGDIQAAKGDLNKAEQEATEMIARAAMAAKGAGEATGSAKAFIQDYESKEELNWRSELQNFFTRMTRGRPHYRKPSRRHQDSELIFPNNRTREPADMVLLVDMSGSMPDHAVAAVYDQINDIVKANRSIKVRLVPFDGKVFEEQVKMFDSSNTPIKPADRVRCGYGGTYFMPAIEYAEDQNPSGIVLLTDMMPSDGPAFLKHRSKVPFICLSVLDALYNQKNCQYGVIPEWCRTLQIKP